MARRPVRVFRGTRAQKLTKLQNALMMLNAMDAKETNDASKVNRNPDLFFQTNTLTNAFQRLWDQIDACKALRR